MSYSCGKDSTLALHKMIRQQQEPVALIVMINQEADRSFFHGADRPMLKRYSEALGVPVILAAAQGENYHTSMEEALKQAKRLGADTACFGDIDIKENRAWCEQRCNNAGLKPVFPLWHNDRTKNVYELIESGYHCLIKCINNTLLPESLLGTILDKDTVQELSGYGIDVCGENGEYHTLVIDGPVFHHPVVYKKGGILRFGDYSVVEVE